MYAYALEVPGVGTGRVCERGGASESSVCVEAVLGKEIQLMHRAPVVSICVLDGRGKPLPDPYEASQDLAITPDMTNAHSVLIASEEQLKVEAGRHFLYLYQSLGFFAFFSPHHFIRTYYVLDVSFLKNLSFTLFHLFDHIILKSQ